MNHYYRSKAEEFVDIDGSNQNVLFPDRNDWFTASQRTMFSGVTQTIVETADQEKEYNYVLADSCEGVDRFPHTCPVIQTKKVNGKPNFTSSENKK